MDDMTARFRPHFETVTDGKPLSEEAAREAFGCIMQGAVPEIQLAAFLAAMKARGETVDEITGAVAAMRGLMVKVEAPGCIDIVGTGGDAKGTFNISTASAFVLAGAGVKVAKHGNRAVSSKSGSADVLESLGVNVRMAPDLAPRCIKEAGLVFLFAPNHHPAMKHAAPVRQALKLRTIFNLLGPLLNPAGTKRQLIGVYSERWLLPMAKVMQRLGAEHVWVVHGSDGMDELTTTGKSRVVEVKHGGMREFEVQPADAGLDTVTLAGLLAGSPAESAEAMRSMLRGASGPFRDIVLLNAGAGFVVAGLAQTLREGAGLAAQSIDSGRAFEALQSLIAFSNGASHASGTVSETAAALAVPAGLSKRSSRSRALAGERSGNHS
jgi:anthranilate phosphoribosyltransferase